MFETEPLPDVVAEIARHLATEHGHTDFELARDVAYKGNTPQGAVIVYRPETPTRPAGYGCGLCPGRLFYPVDPTYGHPARNARLEREHPELRQLVAALDPDEAAIVIEDWDRGPAARSKEHLEEILQRQGRATKHTGRPEVVERKARCQDYLLAAWERLGTQDKAIWELIALADEDPSEHQRIVGGRYPMAYDTYHQYLGEVPLVRRAEVKARIRDR